MKKALVWFRNDVRLHDQAVIDQAVTWADEVYYVFILDQRLLEQHELGFTRTGSFRLKFILESVADLRVRMAELKTPLLFRQGEPNIILTQLAEELDIQRLYASQEVTPEEKQTERQVETSLWKKQVECHWIWQHSLYHIEDIPFNIANLPDVFTPFRKETERTAIIRKQIKDIHDLKAGSRKLEAGALPTLTQLGITNVAEDRRRAITFTGGESAALDRLETYFWDGDYVAHYKNTRNNLIGPNYSSKFSPWLALGCLSPRRVYWELKTYEQERTKNSSTYWLYFELMWRDYFRFVAKKYGSAIFKPEGIKGVAPEMENDQEKFERWQRGETKEAFVNANMTELNETGFMSNRGRQNVASYLVHDLQVNWTWGAAWFEHKLIDYDPCSNWANWCYVAGVGTDPRPNRYFNIQSQQKKYDPNGTFIAHWLVN